MLKFSEEETLSKLKTLLAQCPILIFELNKIMPKNNKLLPLLNQNNSDEFLEKMKNKDEYVYKEFIKLIMEYRDDNISIESLTNKVEALLNKYPELLEEAMLFIDHKKLNAINYRKNIINKTNINNNYNINNNQNNNNINYQSNFENNQSNIKKENKLQNKNINSSPVIEKNQVNKYNYHQDINKIPTKIQSSIDYMFFNGLKDLFPPEIYKILIKILFLYIEGIISQYEFSVLITPIQRY